jgi:predicted metalloprotease
MRWRRGGSTEDVIDVRGGGAQGCTSDRAKLVLYRNGVQTACGSASSAVGPFYCPGDRRVYLDLSFYRDMERQLQASGDFAWAYVIAHELGHHVQQVLGTSAQVDQIRRTDPDRANEASVRLELQADCYAGVWAHTVFQAGDLEAGDIDEAVNASEAVGDDRLQSQAGRRINPDSFTHGSSAQRHAWFERGRARRAGRLRHVLGGRALDPITPGVAGTFEGHARLHHLRHRARPLRDRVG